MREKGKLFLMKYYSIEWPEHKNPIKFHGQNRCTLTVHEIFDRDTWNYFWTGNDDVLRQLITYILDARPAADVWTEFVSDVDRNDLKYELARKCDSPGFDGPLISREIREHTIRAREITYTADGKYMGMDGEHEDVSKFIQDHIDDLSKPGYIVCDCDLYAKLMKNISDVMTKENLHRPDLDADSSLCRLINRLECISYVEKEPVDPYILMLAYDPCPVGDKTDDGVVVMDTEQYGPSPIVNGPLAAGLFVGDTNGHEHFKARYSYAPIEQSNRLEASVVENYFKFQGDKLEVLLAEAEGLPHGKTTESIAQVFADYDRTFSDCQVQLLDPYRDASSFAPILPPYMGGTPLHLNKNGYRGFTDTNEIIGEALDARVQMSIAEAKALCLTKPLPVVISLQQVRSQLAKIKINYSWKPEEHMPDDDAEKAFRKARTWGLWNAVHTAFMAKEKALVRAVEDAKKMIEDGLRAAEAAQKGAAQRSAMIAAELAVEKEKKKLLEKELVVEEAELAEYQQAFDSAGIKQLNH